MKRPQPVSAPKHATIVALVFGGGAVGMMLELVGARLLAPYFGNSLFVWTSLIGVMLGFMSLGYYLGGRLADARLDKGNLFWILSGAAIAVALVTFSESSLLPFLAAGGAKRVLAVVSATILFAVPSTLLGMVSPYCIRLRMHAIEDSGATVGTLYAISTLGSIVGTFAAGFWLIAVFGTHDFLLVLAGALACLSLLVIDGRFVWQRYATLALLVALVVLGASGVARGAESVDTQYDRYFIREVADPATGEPMIALSRDSVGAESASYLDDRAPYVFDYYRYYDMANTLTGDLSRVLVIGGGTFSYPRLLVAAHPDLRVDAVEIDPDLYRIAKSDFGYVDDDRITLYFEDGRMFLNSAEGPYDVVYMDAFKSEATVPYQLTTVETWTRAFEVLDEDGVLVMNVIGSPTDERARFFNALFSSIQEVFPQVRAFEVKGAGAGGVVHNTMIVAAKSRAVDIDKLVAQRAPQFADSLMAGYAPPAGTRALTDDHAPVDQYLLGF